MDPEQVLAHLARELRHAREARGLSRRRLAERAGLSIETIKELEQGQGFHPRLETMVRLASGLGVALVELVRCVDPGLTEDDRARAGSVNVWLAGLDEPSRALVLALVQVLARPSESPTPRVSQQA
ncbi:MAG: helix-turn-helix transcriptional regulator [Nannocystaceae bacterium]